MENLYRTHTRTISLKLLFCRIIFLYILSFLHDILMISLIMGQPLLIFIKVVKREIL